VSGVDVLVVLLGVALIAGELWFFLGPRPKPVPPTAEQPVQEVRIIVKGGYDPDTIFVEAGRPVRLLFQRDETVECSERVVFEGLEIDRELPAFQTTTIEFTPAEPGDYRFRCGKDVLRGVVVAQTGGERAHADAGKGHLSHA
jgi:Cu+-exporting ATPase